MNERFYNAVAAALEEAPARSAWDRGVKEYARDIWADMCGSLISPEALLRSGDGSRRAFREALLNGARTWKEYSYGGCALIYDADIASRLCTPSEYRRSLGGERNPNRSETWLDVQARALRAAEVVLWNACSRAYRRTFPALCKEA